jgi:hypothetical protein
MVTSHSASNGISVLLNRGDGTFSAPRQVQVGQGPVAIAGADFDRDGALDLAVANRESADLFLLFNDGGGGFRPSIEPLVDAPRFVDSADIDRDGHPDLVVASDVGASLSILWNRGDGSFGEPQTLLVDAAPWSVVSGDINGDGALDLVTANAQQGGVSVLLQLSGERFSQPTFFPTGHDSRFVAAADFDGAIVTST